MSNTAARATTKQQPNGNLKYFHMVESVPAEAKKPIEGGRLKGMTSINPMWRIKALTEAFGPAGFGWKVEIPPESFTDNTGIEVVRNPWYENFDNGEKTIYLKVHLFTKIEGEWSEPIVGFGSAKLRAKERNYMYFDIDAYKKAYTDAIGNAAKMLGVGASVYMNEDDSKYNAPFEPQQYAPPQPPVQQPPQPMPQTAPAVEILPPVLDDTEIITPQQVEHVKEAMKAKGRDVQRMLGFFSSKPSRKGKKALKNIEDMTYGEYKEAITLLSK